MNNDYDDTMEFEPVSLDALSAQIHAINVSKGFWPDNVADRNVGEALALIHSELSEAYEFVLNGQFDDKLTQYPGWQVEIADAAIRTLDLGGAHDISFDFLTRATIQLNPLTSFIEDTTYLHKLTSNVLEAHRKNAVTTTDPTYGSTTTMLYKVLLADLLAAFFQVGLKYDFDLLEIIDAKVAFNKGRPYKHGKQY